MFNALIITAEIMAILYGAFKCAVNAAHLILIAEDQNRKTKGIEPLNPEHTDGVASGTVWFRFLIYLTFTIYMFVLLCTQD